MIPSNPLSTLAVALVMALAGSARSTLALPDRTPPPAPPLSLPDGRAAPAAATDPLLRIGQQMRTIQQRLSDQDTSKPTQWLQQQAADELAQLIDRMETQCNSASQGQTQTKQSSATGPPKPSGGPARDSVSRLDQQATGSAGPDRARQLNRQTWGDLPPALRQSVLNADFESFLPKYQRLIEQYFERLSEERGEQP